MSVVEVYADRRPTDLLAPHILRSLSNLEIVEIIAGCAADFFVALDSELPL